MAYFLDNYPVSEKGSDLILTEEQEKFCKVVYRLSDDENDDGAYFAGLWNPDLEYSDDYLILPLRTTGLEPQPVTILKNTCFANVIGSGKDNFPEKYFNEIRKRCWLTLWKRKTGSEFLHECTTDGNFYYRDWNGQECILNGIFMPDQKNSQAPCCSPRDNMRGGHVIVGATAAAEVAPTKKVWIIPICHNHNVASSVSGGRFGTGFYMKLKADTKALVLIGYLKGIKTYIMENGDECKRSSQK